MQSGHHVVQTGWGLVCCTQDGEHEIGLMQQSRLVVLHADPCHDKVMANAYADSNSNSSERIREPPPLGLHPRKAEVTAAVPAALTSAHLPGGHPSRRSGISAYSRAVYSRFPAVILGSVPK